MACVQLLQLKPTLARNENEEKKWKNFISTLKSGNGVVSVAWALQHEDSKIAGIASSWKSYDDQKAWRASMAGEESNNEMKSLSSGSVYEDVVIFPKDAGPTIKANAVELVSWIHPVSKIDAERERKVADGFAKFQKAISRDAPESDGGLVGGWGQIEFQHDGVNSRRFTALIGWKSVDSHYDCKKTKPFLDNIHFLMNNDHSGIEMVHFAYSKSLKDGNSSL